MPRRHEERFYEPTPEPLTPKSSAIIYKDMKGRAWTARYLISNGQRFTETTPWDSTHRGFAWEEVRIIYRFQRGDDRGSAHDVLHLQFTSGRRISTRAERDARRAAQSSTPTREDRREERYRGQGMRPR